MSTAIDYRKEIINLTEELPKNKVRELWDFAQFLKARSTGSRYTDEADSAAYVRKTRSEEGKRVKTSKKFIEELVEWQKSNS